MGQQIIVYRPIRHIEVIRGLSLLQGIHFMLIPCGVTYSDTIISRYCTRNEREGLVGVTVLDLSWVLVNSLKVACIQVKKQLELRTFKIIIMQLSNCVVFGLYQSGLRAILRFLFASTILFLYHSVTLYQILNKDWPLEMVSTPPTQTPCLCNNSSIWMWFQLGFVKQISHTEKI